MTHLSRPLFLVAVLFSISSVAPATTDQLREWIIANKNALPKSAQEALTSATESDLASTILRMFGFGSEKITTTTLTVTTPTTTPRSGVKVSERDVCPFNADPLILSGEYAYCKPSSQGDCPVGFVCDQSFVLGRSICCQDLRSRPGARISQSGGLGGNVVISIAVPGAAGNVGNVGNVMKSVKPVSWSTVTPNKQTTRWTPSPTSTRRAPWYIKDKTPWNSVYNRVTPEIRTTTVPTTTTQKLTTQPIRATPPITTAKPVNPWAKLWTTTKSPKNNVNVTVLQAGSVRTLQDGQMEMVGAITLINDSGMRVLVDTGSAADTERLLQIHLSANFANWYGLIKNKSELMLPKIIVKMFTICISLGFSIFIYWCTYQGNGWMIDNLMKYGKVDYNAAKAVITYGGVFLVFAASGFTITQILFFYILYESISREKITLDEIETVVITHGHPGHMGNMNFFGQKPILFHSMEYIGRHVTPTELKERPYRKLSSNIEVWKTPGHTQHDLSVLVHNVDGYGSMAIVGDLIPTEAFISDNIDAMGGEGAWDTGIKRQNANLIICMADWIVPGHGQPFRVQPQYRQKAGCTRLLAQRHILNAAA
ncbi:hypothetical protein FO519_001835 [Halicephalobus sp. NKZ332]|nr:hypothetical protein FO519_001835 [Halicephalobus sp. NKZ332]